MTSNSRYSMLDSMDIRCARCGYENNPQFRFCGMCGGALRPRDPEQREETTGRRMSEGEIISQRLMENSPPPPEPMPVEPLIAELAAAQKRQAESVRIESPRSYSRELRDESHSPEAFHGQRTAVPVTGPSFLGLSESEDDRRVEYLLEDEPHPGRMRTVIGLLLLLAICAAGIFYWRKSGYPYPWPSQTAKSTTGAGPVADNSSTHPTVIPSEVAPPMESRQIAEKPKTGVGDNPLPQGMDSKTPGIPAGAKDQKDAESKLSASGNSDTHDAEDIENTESGLATEGKANAARTTELAKPRPLKPSPVVGSPLHPAADGLFLLGQKYLYGTGGVPANCARAQQYLTASANTDNPKAQSTLGTMYATGHCARHDLPTAYRWFARALHGDPHNIRLERDVQIMWDQMTPQERNLALKN